MRIIYQLYTPPLHATPAGDEEHTAPEELGRIEYGAIPKALLPKLHVPQDPDKALPVVYIHQHFAGQTSKDWQVMSIEHAPTEVVLQLKPSTSPGYNYGEEAEKKGQISSKLVRPWTLVWVDFSHHSLHHTLGGEAPARNTRDRNSLLPGEHYKLRPCIVVQKRSETVTVVPLSTQDYNASMTHSILISDASFNGAYKKKDKPSYAVLDWMTTVSSFRIFSLPDTTGKPLMISKAPNLTPHDKTNVQSGLAAYVHPSSQQQAKLLLQQLESQNMELKTTKENLYERAEELRETQVNKTRLENLLLAIATDLGEDSNSLDKVFASLEEAYGIDVYGG